MANEPSESFKATLSNLRKTLFNDELTISEINQKTHDICEYSLDQLARAEGYSSGIHYLQARFRQYVMVNGNKVKAIPEALYDTDILKDIYNLNVRTNNPNAKLLTLGGAPVLAPPVNNLANRRPSPFPRKNGYELPLRANAPSKYSRREFETRDQGRPTTHFGMAELESYSIPITAYGESGYNLNNSRSRIEQPREPLAVFPPPVLAPRTPSAKPPPTRQNAYQQQPGVKSNTNPVPRSKSVAPFRQPRINIVEPSNATPNTPLWMVSIPVPKLKTVQFPKFELNKPKLTVCSTQEYFKEIIFALCQLTNGGKRIFDDNLALAIDLLPWHIHSQEKGRTRANLLKILEAVPDFFEIYVTEKYGTQTYGIIIKLPMSEQQALRIMDHLKLSFEDIFN